MTDPTGTRATIPKNLKNFLVLTAVVSAAISGGCAPTINKGTPTPIPQADRIGLYVPPNAIVNWDGKPGFDGVVVQVMLFKTEGAKVKSVLVTGEVDIMIYEGAIPDNLNDADKPVYSWTFTEEAKPFFSWTFTADELAQRVVGQYNALWGYSLHMEWKVPPKTAKVWLIARYRPPSGKAIYSSPAEQIMPVEMPKAKK